MREVTLSRFAADQGFKIAYNLDGGNSAVMYWKGDVYNRPSGGGGRSISDILYIASGEAVSADEPG